MSQRDVKNRISSVKNIEKITRAMQMVAAARLRRAEQRIAALRPYAGAIRRMTRQAAEAAGAEASSLPLLREHEQQDTVATFKKQEADLLYRIWPEKPLEPGEYALIQFTPGKVNPQIWDFGVDRSK